MYIKEHYKFIQKTYISAEAKECHKVCVNELSMKVFSILTTMGNLDIKLKIR